MHVRTLSRVRPVARRPSHAHPHAHGTSAQLVKRNMETEHGMGFIEKATPSSIELAPSGKKLVKWAHTDGTAGEGEYDTVLLAVGRDVRA